MSPPPAKTKASPTPWKNSSSNATPPRRKQRTTCEHRVAYPLRLLQRVGSSRDADCNTKALRLLRPNRKLKFRREIYRRKELLKTYARANVFARAARNNSAAFCF